MDPSPLPDSTAAAEQPIGTLREAVEAKWVLEAAILSLIQAYEQRTRLTVRSIRTDTVRAMGGPFKTVMVDVEVWV